MYTHNHSLARDLHTNRVELPRARAEHPDRLRSRLAAFPTTRMFCIFLRLLRFGRCDRVLTLTDGMGLVSTTNAEELQLVIVQVP
jgi:hypothetical protein